jgi:hypothetical protein
MPIDILIGYTTFLFALAGWAHFEVQGRTSLFGNAPRPVRIFQFLIQCTSTGVSAWIAAVAWQAQDIRNFSVQAVLTMLTSLFAHRIWSRLDEAE